MNWQIVSINITTGEECTLMFNVPYSAYWLDFCDNWNLANADTTFLAFLSDREVTTND